MVSPHKKCTAGGNPGAKSNLWISQPQAPKQDMHYVTFKITYLSVKNAVTTFRSTISFSGSCFSSSEVLDPIPERCNFQHTPHTLPPIYTNTKIISSVLYLPLCTKSGSFGEQDINQQVSNMGIPSCARPSKSLQNL